MKGLLMNSTSITEFETLEKEINTLAQAFSTIKKEWASLKKTELNINQSLPAIDTSVQKIMKEIETLKNSEGYRKQLEDFCRTLATKLEEEKTHFRTAFINSLAKGLSSHGFEMKGALPELKIGIVTLAFSFEQKEVTLYYGPKIYPMGTVTLDTEKIIEKVKSLLDDLNNHLIPDHEFIKLLYMAYDRMVRLGKTETSGSVGIYELMPEFVLLMQPEQFLKDPKKENFKNYTKIYFSYNIYKLRERTYNGNELQLNIATREETKKTYAHLWVPQNDRGDGVHFGGVRFNTKLHSK